MASAEGLEPTTPGLGNQCSILMSYADVCLLIIVNQSKLQEKKEANASFFHSSIYPNDGRAYLG